MYEDPKKSLASDRIQRLRTKYSVDSGKKQAKEALGGIPNTLQAKKKQKQEPGIGEVADLYRLAYNQNRQVMSDAVAKSSSPTNYSDLEDNYGEDAVASRPPKYSEDELVAGEFISEFDVDTDMDAALEAFAAVESRGSGGYKALGKVIESGMYKGDRAYGRYQVMGKNIPVWTKKYLGESMTKEDFLNSPEAQDNLIKAFLREKYEKYGTIEDAVSEWFTGDPLKKAQDRNASDGDSTVNEYVSKFRREFLNALES